eukprot:12289-Heterococcus_DN1.PRE.3
MLRYSSHTASTAALWIAANTHLYNAVVTASVFGKMPSQPPPVDTAVTTTAVAINTVSTAVTRIIITIAAYTQTTTIHADHTLLTITNGTVYYYL